MSKRLCSSAETDMKKISRQIDRDGEWTVKHPPMTHDKAKCDHCQLRRSLENLIGNLDQPVECELDAILTVQVLAN